jgi:hypothetical protein
LIITPPDMEGDTDAKRRFVLRLELTRLREART